MLKSKSLIFLQLNEINFDIVKTYNHELNLTNLNKLLSAHHRLSTAEKKYEDLEPWIQWVSVHTGMDLSEHGVYRLGDIVYSDKTQILELLETYGFSVGAVSPMNVKNVLESPRYFIPDPWTATESDNSYWSKRVAQILRQTVNENAQSKISFKSYFWLGLVWLRFARLKNYFFYVKLALTSYGKPWRKALFLDLLLNDIHLTLYRNKKPNFSILFLNGGAHIQHHYLFNAKLYHKNQSIKNPNWYISAELDPFKEMLFIYDQILGDYVDSSEFDWLLATGLTQEAYDRVKFYWRLRDHRGFLIKLGVKNFRVLPRMTRDFVIEFNKKEDRDQAYDILESCQEFESGERFFGEIEKRENSLFVTLTFSKDLNHKSRLGLKNGLFIDDLKKELIFVALKNGMHSNKGYIFCSPSMSNYLPVKNAHVKELYNNIIEFFQK